ncbi:RNA 2',3'-cyclic phosphodiesterase [Sinosporangium siamense]|uniref:RNA 2',3'-cyclic phosphodiesterase n=1 Tax=Sinosporangium siamense TaxID=1367973 RepID=A0A919RJ69_9ACTN|nr:RNA 2',3'-cyclic phosphodiesterase [Sinosporangium siamense]GII94807.1 RNA 2',3'-cyclic phosphodiesterase [Sinosporangium siamense]
MRLFTALLPPPAVLGEVERALEPHRDAWPGLRWVDPATWHLTLTFMGEVPADVQHDLEVRLARAASRRPPMTLSFAGAGAFPSRKRARVLWIGVCGPKPVLSRLADSSQAAARRAGAAHGEARPFHPHLTVARTRTRTGGDDVRELVEALAEFEGTEWRAEEIHLMRSHLGPRVRYESLRSWPLHGRNTL